MPLVARLLFMQTEIGYAAFCGRLPRTEIMLLRQVRYLNPRT